MSSSEYWDKSKIVVDDTSTSNSAYSSPSPNTGIQAAKEQAKFNSWLIGEIEDLWTAVNKARRDSDGNIMSPSDELFDLRSRVATLMEETLRLNRALNDHSRDLEALHVNTSSVVMDMKANLEQTLKKIDYDGIANLHRELAAIRADHQEVLQPLLKQKQDAEAKNVILLTNNRRLRDEVLRLGGKVAMLMIDGDEYHTVEKPLTDG
jgi:chromosome segregation ATPase